MLFVSLKSEMVLMVHTSSHEITLASANGLRVSSFNNDNNNNNNFTLKHARNVAQSALQQKDHKHRKRQRIHFSDEHKSIKILRKRAEIRVKIDK